MRDLLWRTRFRWSLWPRQVTGDRKYGTEDNLVAIEDQDIRAYIPLADLDHRTECLSADQFRYEAERAIFLASCRWVARTVLGDVSASLWMGSDSPVNKWKCITPS